ncbi:NYN domain-containing protein [Paenibacillus larvae]
MEEVLIVDGYNIIGAWPDLQKWMDSGMEEARDRLIHMLAEYQSYSGIKVYLVFDAYKIPGLGKKYNQHRLTILFTKEKETADELIERLVTEHVSRRKRIYVATSDMTEQHVIFGKGALRLPAGELLVKIRQNQKEIGSSLKEDFVPGRNTFDRSLSDEQRLLLEQWRRGRD